MIPRKTLNVRRPSGGTRVKGKWIPGTFSALPTIKSTVQVVTGRDLQELPEGRRTTQSFVIYTNTLLNVELEGDGEPDEVEIFGDWCEVIYRGPWQNLIKHRRYIVQRNTSK